MSTTHHVDETLEAFGEALKGNVVNPATLQPFTITSEAKELDKEKKERYHSMTDKIFWIVKHSQPDLEIAVYFICTWVQYPTKEYWGKLRILLNYIKATK